MNGNYELAYIGIGRALLRQQNYKEAMEYFEVMRDDENYSRAWKYYRKDWIENNLGYVIIVLVVLGTETPNHTRPSPIVLHMVRIADLHSDILSRQYQFQSNHQALQ